MLVDSSVFNPQGNKQEKTTSGKISSFSQSSSPKTCSMSFPPTRLLFVLYLVYFVQCHTCFSSLCDLFLVPTYSMQYSYPIQSTHSSSKRESCLSAICHLLSWIQQLSVGCSIFLIVANFLVQFYATFTWMFMTLSAATQI